MISLCRRQAPAPGHLPAGRCPQDGQGIPLFSLRKYKQGDGCRISCIHRPVIFPIPHSRPRTLWSRSGFNNAQLRYTCAQSGHYNARGVEPPPALRRTMKNFFDLRPAACYQQKSIQSNRLSSCFPANDYPAGAAPLPSGLPVPASRSPR